MDDELQHLSKSNEYKQNFIKLFFYMFVDIIIVMLNIYKRSNLFGDCSFFIEKHYKEITTKIKVYKEMSL